MHETLTIDVLDLQALPVAEAVPAELAELAGGNRLCNKTVDLNLRNIRGCNNRSLF